MAGAPTSQSDAAADLRELWPQVSALCLTVDPESRPFASKEKASDLLRAYLKAHGVPSADVPASEVSADSPWERCAIAWVACKLGALLTHCEALTEGAAFCRLGTAVLHSEESLCAGDEARPGAADVVHANVCAAAPALEGVGCAGASDAELERFDSALARLDRAAGAIDVAEDKSRDGGDGGRPWPVAWAWLEPEQRPGGDASRAAGTQVFFYLAQVCGHAGRRHDSARYCAIATKYLATFFAASDSNSQASSVSCHASFDAFFDAIFAMARTDEASASAEVSLRERLRLPSFASAPFGGGGACSASAASIMNDTNRTRRAGG